MTTSGTRTTGRLWGWLGTVAGLASVGFALVGLATGRMLFNLAALGCCALAFYLAKGKR